MKLAEALRERADVQREIDRLTDRLDANAIVQEGEETVESPDKLKRELDGAVCRFEHLMAAINRTNCITEIDGVSLTEIIAKKDALTEKLSAYRSVVQTASQTAYRARHSEIKIKATVDVAAWQREIDEMSKQLRLLDNTLQAANWTTELIES